MNRPRLQPLGVERHADPVVPENLDQIDLVCRGRRRDRRHADRASTPPGPGAPGCSCRAACRSGRPPATPARRTEPGSSPRQRLDHGRRQFRRDRARYPHPSLAANSTSIAGSAQGATATVRRSALGRRDQHLGEPGRTAQFLPPAINLPRQISARRATSKTPPPAQSSPRRSPGTAPALV